MSLLLKKFSALIILILFIVFLVIIKVSLDNNSSIKNSSADIISNLNPYSCSVNSPPIILISESIPSYLNVNTKFNVELEVANCSGFTWVPGQHFLGSQDPQDNGVFITNGRINFPVNVPTGHSITLKQELTSPAQTGSSVLQWGLLSTTQWYQPYLPPKLIITGNTQVCSAANALANTLQNAQPIIQNCIDQTPVGGILEIPQGTFMIADQIYINKSITILTENTKELNGTCLLTVGLNCTTLKEAPDFKVSVMKDPSDISMIVIRNQAYTLNKVNLVHLIIDGNKTNIINREVYCAEYYYLIVTIVDNSNFFGNAIINSPCITGFFELGNNNTIAFNYVADNGTHKHNWSDGLTLQHGTYTVMNNTIKNNTDVGLIFWEAPYSHVHFNDISNDKDTQASYADLMINSWDQDQHTVNFTGAEFSYNTIKCNKLCGFGIQIGEKPWRNGTSLPVYGGSIIHNTVDGAIQGINIDGAGVPGNPVTVGYNTITNSGGFNTGACGITSGNINQNPSDIINYIGGQSPDTNKAWRCALPSCNFGSQYCVQPINRCTSFNYSNFGQCNDGLEYRTISNASPSNCLRGDSLLNQLCTPKCTYMLQQNCIADVSSSSLISTSSSISSLVSSISSSSLISSSSSTSSISSINSPNSVCGPLDLNKNGKLDIVDFINFSNLYGKSCSDNYTNINGICGPLDSNKNGKVDIGDFINLAKFYGKTCN